MGRQLTDVYLVGILITFSNKLADFVYTNAKEKGRDYLKDDYTALAGN
jgi:hypothetical protein